MTFRKTIFWLHLISGCVAGVIVLIMSVTGVLLTYERQTIDWFDRGLRAPQQPGRPRMPLEALLAAQPAAPTTVTLRAEPGEPVMLTYGREGTVYVDAYTGATLGKGHTGVRKFFQSMTSWHRWLGQEGPGRQTARAITGACNLAFLFLLMSGLVLWWPRRWTAASLRAVTWFNGQATGKARDFNWHNVIGFWSLAPLLLVVASGVVMSYPWANALLYRMTGSELPVQGAGGGSGGGPPRGEGRGPRGEERRPAAPSYEGLDLLVENAKRQDPEWRVLSFRPAGPRRAPLAFTLDRAERGRPDLRTTVTLDRESGEAVKLERFSDQSAGRRLRTWVRWVHTGEAGGVTGQTVAGLVSLGGVFLVYTGVALSLRRLAAWRRRRGRQADVVETAKADRLG
ncbi:PepSY-associated TM helix domain-containing protein [Paludibaculum fermentans]|uniref:PepSY domain-containing protein n=1 Tax=Paludibaculum fermentans TaxID=1473598 RepID=A0A7S7NXA5_PALFE|nr:PepSY-associated TM helix domain-containing protein [Paludibaculum fermentans]QOY91498.1 PepSY domain-containing protein [Paludibaculum fermentans]